MTFAVIRPTIPAWTAAAFLLASPAGTLAVPFAAGAQQTARIWKIGHFVPGAQPPDRLPSAALREGLQALGYIEGKNITFISR